MEGKPFAEVVAEVVSDAMDRVLPTPIARDTQIRALPGKIDAVLGMRRSGKTWLLFDHAARLVADGLPRDRILYLNFEDERLMPMQAADLHLVLDAFLARFPEHAGQECWLLFDEIQNVPGWDRWLRRLIDRGGLRIAVTGSSAKLLGTEIATALRGRSLPTELLPYSFAEALRHEGVALPKRWPPPEATRALLKNRFRRFLDVGGFPEVQGLDEPTRRRVLQDYVDVALLRDVIERHGVGNPGALRWLVRRLLGSPGGAFTVNKAYGDLRSQGHTIAKDTVHAYVAWLEDAFLFLPVEAEAASERARAVRPRKIYAVDHALAGVTSVEGGGIGHRLENIVYVELRRRGYQVRYVPTPHGYEVDFLAVRGDERRLVQVCADLGGEAFARELRAIEDALPALGMDHAEIVTLEDDRVREVEGGRVTMTSAWRWLLAP